MNGKFEYGGRFYMSVQKRGAYTLADEWWFVQGHEIRRKLNSPHLDKISVNRRFYYFDDYVVEEK